MEWSFYLLIYLQHLASWSRLRGGLPLLPTLGACGLWLPWFLGHFCHVEASQLSTCLPGPPSVYIPLPRTVRSHAHFALFGQQGTPYNQWWLWGAYTSQKTTPEGWGCWGGPDALVGKSTHWRAFPHWPATPPSLLSSLPAVHMAKRVFLPHHSPWFILLSPTFHCHLVFWIPYVKSARYRYGSLLGKT